ncbi:ParA family protein [Xanthobacter oligotrophicus]|uniref:ParA family protein n=1 Tax=Xanthobacter oligotrophicus TaxID=2607286 RepID=A0ABW6ZW14_9HYPH
MSHTSYAIWNNKGGVGKSTITFHLALRVAERCPNKKVLVIDLCPQANASMMLLGGGVIGEKTVLDFCTQPTPMTVVGYLSEVISGGERAPLPNLDHFIKNVNDYNKNIPKNVYLLCGDGNLEPMAPAITMAANAPKLTPVSNPWSWVHTIFKRLIEEFSKESDVIAFVDTNPSFSVYTELAVSSAEKLIVPVNADDSSRIAANAMFVLLHGTNPPHPVYGQWTYAEKAKAHSVQVPSVHLVVGNRLTQYAGAAAAYQALSDATAGILFKAFKSDPSYFSPPMSVIDSIDDFRNEYSVSLRDFNTAGVVSSHIGNSINNMRQGYYTVHSHNVKVNADQIQEALKALDIIVDKLVL